MRRSSSPTVRLAGASRSVPADLSAATAGNELDVAVQFATRRSGVPHPDSLRKWAAAAFAGGAADSASVSGVQPPATALPLSIRIVGAAESRRLNRAWRGQDKPTNVLSFPCAEPRLVLTGVRGSAPSAPLGDLAICAPVVAREARDQGKSSRAHWAHMVVHGVLHLLGYDHEIARDAELMEAREMVILAHFGYANPYA